MNTTELADLYERAADDLLIRGHTKGRLINEAGEVCEVGALACAAGVEITTATPLSSLIDHGIVHEAWAPLALKGRGFAWNDAHSTTAGDVRDLFLHEAKELRNAEKVTA